MAAKQGRVSTLHEMLTELFIADIELCKAEGIPMSASDKAVIVKFLKDNNVTAEPDDEKMQGLMQEFQDELAAKRAAKAEKLLMQAQVQDDVNPLAEFI